MIITRSKSTRITSNAILDRIQNHKFYYSDQDKLFITMLCSKSTYGKIYDKMLLVECPSVFKYFRKPASQSPSKTPSCSALYSAYLPTTLSILVLFWTYLRFLRGGSAPKSANLLVLSAYYSSFCKASRNTCRLGCDFPNSLLNRLFHASHVLFVRGKPLMTRS